MSKQLLQFFILFVLLLFSGCDNKQSDTLNIGFVAGLSGKYSTLGTDVRDGFLLAFDQINYQINNTKIKIIQKDDKQEPKQAKEIINFFIQNNIKLIIGNTTSSMTKVSLDIVNKHPDMLMLSATASSTELSGIDDNFLRVQVDNGNKKIDMIANYFTEHNLDKIVMLYDSNNVAYTNDYDNTLQNSIIAKGGNPYLDKIDINQPLNNIKQSLEKLNPNLIIIVANSLDSAKLIQYIRYNHIKSQIFCTGWAQDNDFIQNGAKAVEGVLFISAYNENNQNKKFQDFVQSFQKQYARMPSENAMQGYELGLLLIDNIKQSSDISTLKQRIIDNKIFHGLQGDIVFDKYGDVQREYYMIKIQNGKYIKLND